MQQNKHRKAFTLVELLVVIGIIAVLVSILLPALNRARESALSVQCMSNQRQVFSGLSMYINDHSGALPYNSGSNTSATVTDWRHKISRYISDVQEYQQYNWSYHPLFECPAKIYLDASTYPHFTLDGRGFRPGTAINRSLYQLFVVTKVSQIRNASETFFTADTPDNAGFTFVPNTAYAANLHPFFLGYFHRSNTSSYNALLSQNRRSGGVANIAFMDGHVESLPQSAIVDSFWGLK